MRRNFTNTYSWGIIIAIAIFMNCALAQAVQLPQNDTINYFPTKKKPKKGLLNLTFPPFHAGVQSTVKLSIPAGPDDKLLSNVEVYPNPITDQINLKYVISRNSNVTIKLVDVLGNDVIPMFSRRVEAGEKTFNYPLPSKLNRGFYFIRIIAGTESVIKRISVL